MWASGQTTKTTMGINKYIYTPSREKKTPGHPGGYLCFGQKMLRVRGAPALACECKTYGIVMKQCTHAYSLAGHLYLRGPLAPLPPPPHGTHTNVTKGGIHRSDVPQTRPLLLATIVDAILNSSMSYMYQHQHQQVRQLDTPFRDLTLNPSILKLLSGQIATESSALCIVAGTNGS